MFTSQDDRYPAIFSSTPAPSTSSKYSFLSTKQLIEALEPHGFSPSRMNQGRSLSPYARHHVTLEHASLAPTALASNDQVRFRVELYNSHGAQSSLKLYAGVIRFACDNGMVLGDNVASFKARHSRLSLDDVIEGAFRVVNESTPVLEQMRAMQGKELSKPQRVEFAVRAIAVRWPDPSKSLFTPYDALQARRYDDLGDDLWRVYQRLQENLTKGGRSSNPDHRTSVRALASPTTALHVNAGLWGLATEYLEAA